MTQLTDFSTRDPIGNDNGGIIEVFSDMQTVVRAAAERFVQLANAAVKDHGVFSVALSGGSTPQALYEFLAADSCSRSKVPWSKVHAFFGDERHVPPDHKESNFRMANEAMLESLQGEGVHVHRVRSELPSAWEAAGEYEADIRDFFEPRARLDSEFPRFDLIFLGMGPDGHTASLFPDSAGLSEARRWVVANRVEKFKTDRITVTFPVLNSAAEIIILVAGPEKAGILAEVLDAGTDQAKYPIQRIRPRKGVKRWMMDDSAAARFLETLR